MSLDIFNPTISKVSRGLEGKTLLLYGQNSSGKTKQASRMSKPFYLGFEKGINAISGVPYHYVTKWAEFKKINKQLSGKDREKAREVYDTIIFDTVEIAAMYCQNYVAGQHGATDIASGNKGFGLWNQYKEEFWTEIDLLTTAGYTVVFIGHQTKDKDTEQFIPAGDVRSMGIVRDLVDITVFLMTNGVDEEGNVILSTGYVRETPEFFARARFDFMPSVIDPFTAENLEKAIITGIEREEETSEGSTVSYDEFVEQNTGEELVFSELQDRIVKMGQAYHEEGLIEYFTEGMADTFNNGEPIQVAELSDKQVEAMSIFIDEMSEKYQELTADSEEE